MGILYQVVIMVITLSVLIAFHEWGHYIVARRCGVRVLRFSIGFGTPLLKWKDRAGTEFVFAAFPLGGYVKMLDEREQGVELPAEEKPMAFNNKPVWQRMAIVAAGPIANLLLALLVYWIVFLRGTIGLAPVIYTIEPGSVAEQAGLVAGEEIVAVDGESTATVQQVSLQLIKRIGETGEIVVGTARPGSDLARNHSLKITGWMGEEAGEINPFSSLGIGFFLVNVEPVIAEVMVGSAAERAGMKKGDRILRMDGNEVTDWMAWVAYVRERPNVAITLLVEREGLQQELVLTPRLVDEKGRKFGQAGVSVKPPVIPEHLLRKEEYSIFSAWIPAAERTWQMSVFSLKSLQKMVMGDISHKQLSGPISIARIASESAESGIYQYLSLLALLSVSLGVLNLLPVPVLDGGHLLFYTAEWIRGSALPERVQQVATQVGMAIVLAMMVLAIMNDLGRL